MDYGAIDLHKRRSQVRIVREDGTVVWTGGIATTRSALTTDRSGRGRRLRILIESSTESEWVAQHLETLGHEVIVADPGYVAMYSARSRKVKTDGRDVQALAEACRTGVYRRAHRASPAARALRRTLRPSAPPGADAHRPDQRGASAAAPGGAAVTERRERAPGGPARCRWPCRRCWGPCMAPLRTLIVALSQRDSTRPIRRVRIARARIRSRSICSARPAWARSWH